MTRRGIHKRAHWRTSIHGRRYRAGRGVPKSVISGVLEEKEGVTYRREGWSDSRIDDALRQKKMKVRRRDVGRPKHHYINMYYYAAKPSARRGKLVKTTMHRYQ